MITPPAVAIQQTSAAALAGEVELRVELTDSLCGVWLDHEESAVADAAAAERASAMGARSIDPAPMVVAIPGFTARMLPGGPGEVMRGNHVVSGFPQVGDYAESTRHDALQNGTGLAIRRDFARPPTAGGGNRPDFCAEWISVVDQVSQ
jgi:hypothetical protein